MIITRSSFLKEILKKYLGVILNIAISSILVTLIGINWPLIYKIIVDEVFVNQSVSVLIYIVVLYFVMFLFEKSLQFLWKLSDAISSTELLNDLRLKIYKKSYTMKSNIKDNIGIGQLADMLNNDVKRVYELLVADGIYTLTSFLRFVISILIIFSLNIKVGLVILFLIPINYILSNYFKNKFLVYYTQLKKEDENYNSWFFDVLTGLREIKYLAAVGYVKKNVFYKLRTICFLDIKQEKESQHNDNTQVGLSFISDIIIYSITGYAIIFDNMTIGDFVAINIYYGWSKFFFQSIIKFFVNKERIFISIDRIIGFLNLEDEVQGGNAISNGDIILDNVHFSYGEKKVLNGIDITIRKGRSTAIVGQSGSGKSTITSLILKLYEPSAGKITINNNNINDLRSSEIRNSIGVVRQEPSMFKDTIRNNLKIVKQDATDEELWKALHLAEASEFVENLPNKLNEIIDGKNNLSAGQIQRIMLARVFLKNSDYIIFDEATSNLDITTEEDFLRNLQENKADKTLIVIAYRVNALKNMDEIYFIQNGRVIEHGNHDFLMRNCQSYAQLVSGNSISVS